MEDILKKDLQDKIEKALIVLDHELTGLRTGRASVNLLNPVSVEAYGNHVPLSQVSTTSAPDASTLSVQVWDKSMVKAVEKAIAESNLGFNPNTEGQIIRLHLPPLSQDRRKELAKLAHQYGEKAKVALRNIRKHGMDLVKKQEKDHEISEDLMHTYSKDIQNLIDDFIKKIDNKISMKEKEILN